MASGTTKHDMVKRVAAETDNPRNVVRQIVQAFLDDIIDELAHGKRLEFRDFGVFDVVTRKPRVARNPRTGDPIHVPAKTIAHFKQGRAMRTRVAEYGETLGQQGEGRPSHRAGAAGGQPDTWILQRWQPYPDVTGPETIRDTDMGVARLLIQKLRK